MTITQPKTPKTSKNAATASLNMAISSGVIVGSDMTISSSIICVNPPVSAFEAPTTASVATTNIITFNIVPIIPKATSPTLLKTITSSIYLLLIYTKQI